MVVKKAVLAVLHKDRSMQDLKQIRWQQRFDNLQRALRQLRKGVSLTEPNELEIQGWKRPLMKVRQARMSACTIC